MLPRPHVMRAAALLATLAFGAVGLVTPVGADPVTTPASKAAQDPRQTRGLFVDPLMPAAQEEAIYRNRIGRVPQAFWVVPEAYPIEAVRDEVRDYTQRAQAARKTPVLVVYGIPGRDCGSHSSDGSLETAAEYRAWVRQVAQGLRAQQALVVVEPDALALFSSPVDPCPTERAGWQRMLRNATKQLSRSGAWVYLDAGHSNWTPHDHRPAVLERAGVEFARGISTNVSNFRPTADEHAYARTTLAGLRKLGVRGKHYVIDTSRNGNPDPSPDGDDVLNPTWARVGKAPGLVFKGAFDGTLWVKHPGESDGYVNGGNASGRWCDMLADRLLRGHSGKTSCPD